MKEIFVIDPVTSSRASLIHQLSSIEYHTLMQYPSLTEAQKSLDSSSVCPELIFVSLLDDFKLLSDFLMNFRQKNQDTCVLTIASSLTVADMRILVQIGVDQILLRPFNTNQLKEKVAAAKNFRQQVSRENIMKPTASQFTTLVEHYTDRFYKLALHGWLAENCILPDVKPAVKDSTLFIDCDRLRGINSIGIRLWILWLKTMNANGFYRFELENLRSSFLQQAAFIQGMIPENSSVNSFYLRYWCPEASSEKEFKISRGKNYATNKMLVPKFQQEVVNGTTVTYEIDGPVEKLLSFYNGTIQIVE